MLRANLTADDVQRGMKALEPKIQRYARLIMRKGVNVTEGQEVVISAPVETCAFARARARGIRRGCGTCNRAVVGRRGDAPYV